MTDEEAADIIEELVEDFTDFSDDEREALALAANVLYERAARRLRGKAVRLMVKCVDRITRPQVPDFSLGLG